MPIENRNLTIGTKLAGKYHKQPYQCEVIAGEAGKLKYRLEDGREFKSPSAAGMAITGHACDGWTFWSVAGTAPATETKQADAKENTTQVEVAPAMETAPEVKAEAAKTEAATETAEVTPAAETAPAKKAKGTRKNIFRLPNQKGVPEGQAKWYCHTCGNFLVKTSETPTTCPNGHNA